MIGWTLASREFRQRPARAALTLASVVIGVAALVAVSFASQATQHAYDAVYASIAGKAALEVSASVGDTIDETLVAKIRQIQGVSVAAPRIQRPTVVFHGKRRIRLFMLGIDPEADKAVQNYRVVSGEWLATRAAAELNADFAANIGAKAGDKISMLTRSGMVKLPVAGLFTTGSVAIPGQGAVLLLPLRAAQTLFKAPKRLDAIQIVLAPDADVESIQAAIGKLLPATATVRPPAARSAMAQETSLSTEQGLEMARACSLLVALFIIANTFLISVTQRRRQLGILRAIGATRRQVVGQILTQAVVLGVAGTILGCAVGVGAAHLLVDAMSGLYDAELPPLQMSIGPFLWAAAFGLGLSLAGAALPARKAAALLPLEALRDVQHAEIEGFSRGMALLGAAIVAACSLVLAASIVGWIDMRHAVWSGVLLLAGIVLLLPIGLGPLAGAAARLAPAPLRVEARLASRQLLIHRSRTALTVGVVFVAVSTGIGLANSVIDNVANVRGWYRKTIVADFIIRASAPEMATGLAADLPDEVASRVRQIPGVMHVDSVRLVQAEAADQPVVITVSNFDSARTDGFDIPGYDAAEVRRRLKHGEVVIGSVLAQRLGLRTGDELELATDEGTQKFPIAAIANDYQFGGLTVLMQLQTAEKHLKVGGADAYLFNVDPERYADAETALEALASEFGLLLQRASDVQRQIDRMMAGVVAGLWGMVALGLVVAAFGVANTLTMSVLEQTHELGLLRIIAMTRRQIRNMVLVEALLMGVLAVVPGLAAGIGVGYLIHLATLPVIGHPVAFGIHPLLLLGGLAGGIAVVMAAAYFPAARGAPRPAGGDTTPMTDGLLRTAAAAFSIRFRRLVDPNAVIAARGAIRGLANGQSGPAAKNIGKMRRICEKPRFGNCPLWSIASICGLG